MTKRKPIGRTLISPQNELLATNQPNSNQGEQTFILKSGKKALFQPESIAADQLADKTFVEQLTNGRDQKALTEEAVEDISRTITLQQFLPAIGRYIDDKIEILDGSRRRAAALYKHVGLFALVTHDEISADDARQLAKDIQTAREHNLREVGLQLQSFEAQGYKQKEMALLNGLSEAKVSRALQAAKVPQEMLALFPDQAELTFPDYKFLLDTWLKFDTQGLPLDELIAAVALEVTSHEPPTAEDAKMTIIAAYKLQAGELLSPSNKIKAEVKSLYQFNNKNQYARKKSLGRKISYEFSRLPEPLHQELEQLIYDKLCQHFDS